MEETNRRISIPELVKVTATFIQDANFNSEKENEILEVTIDAAAMPTIDDHFIVIRTEQWSIDNAQELDEVIKRVKKLL